MEILMSLLFMWVVLNIIYPLICVCNPEWWDMMKLLPCDFKKATHMNWFGCWFVSLLTFVALPPVYIIRFFVWVCHI